jgi:hypothetical protein
VLPDADTGIGGAEIDPDSRTFLGHGGDEENASERRRAAERSKGEAAEEKLSLRRRWETLTLTLISAECLDCAVAKRSNGGSSVGSI